MNKSFNDLVADLAKYKLLENLSRSKAEEQYVQEYEFDDKAYFAPDEEALNTFKIDYGLEEEKEIDKWKKIHKLTNTLKFNDFCHYRNKRRIIVENLLKGQGETLFLRFKDRLDRVLYSILRSDDKDKIYDLFYSIEARELDFGEAASLYSVGAESKTQGIIGPVDLTTPHPEIAARLRTAKPKQLFAPFELNNQYAIVRLEYRFDSEYNEKAKQFLGNLIFNSQYKERISKIYKMYFEEDTI